MKRTISAMVGKGSVRHNNRDFTAENVDKERTKNNIVYCNENIKNVYHELFDDALEKYNAKQTRADRMIKDYYEKIRTGKQEKLFHEVILQIGNMEDMHATSEDGQLAKTVLDKYINGFQERNPNLRVFSAHLHMDEATPHLHIDFVPFTTGSKRGLETRVSLKKALAAQGFVGGSRSSSEWKQWIESEKEVLAECMLEYGIEWDKLGTHNKHRTVDQFKREKLEEEVAELENKKESIEQQIDGYKMSEEYALLTAQKVQEEEWQAPEPPPFITAKSYKVKYVEPLIKKLVECIKTLARRCFRAEKEAEQVKSEVQELYKENQKLKDKVWNQKIEISKLKVKLKNFDKIKKYFGIEKINEWLKVINKGKQKNRAK